MQRVCTYTKVQTDTHVYERDRAQVGTSYPNSHSIRATNFASSLIAGVTDSPQNSELQMGNLLSEQAFARTRSFARVASPGHVISDELCPLHLRLSCHNTSRKILKLEPDSRYSSHRRLVQLHVNNLFNSFRKSLKQV